MYTCACADLFFLISIISSLERHLFEVFNALTSLEYVHSAHYIHVYICMYVYMHMAVYMCMYAYRPLTIVNGKRTPNAVGNCFHTCSNKFFRVAKPVLHVRAHVYTCVNASSKKQRSLC